jgi:hypothetical protein
VQRPSFGSGLRSAPHAEPAEAAVDVGLDGAGADERRAAISEFDRPVAANSSTSSSRRLRETATSWWPSTGPSAPGVAVWGFERRQQPPRAGHLHAPSTAAAAFGFVQATVTAIEQSDRRDVGLQPRPRQVSAHSRSSNSTEK